eukprot:TRINITY_DN3424_c0_g1_i1.p1 TRINITY_DN3424_c0_g1~~TRINITY_DN3424_c0_g1_i1.p1  ORF type:complete len:546 (-),score=46.80 TRINITY_DN3424_c0_g1_i1:68-1705(-)
MSSEPKRIRKRVAADANLKQGPVAKRKRCPAIVITAESPTEVTVPAQKLCLDVELHAAGHFAAVRRAACCINPVMDNSTPAMCLHVADPHNAACSLPFTLTAAQLSAVDVRVAPVCPKNSLPRSLHVLLELHEPLTARLSESVTPDTLRSPHSPDTETALRATGVMLGTDGNLVPLHTRSISSSPETMLAALPRRQRLVQVHVPMEHAAVVTGTLEAMVEANANAGVGVRKGLPSWVGSVPGSLYCRNLRRLVEMATTVWFVFSVFWALWQLYHNLDSVHALLEPVRRRLQAHVQRSLSALNSWLLSFSGWWIEWWRPVSFLITAVLSPFSNNGFIYYLFSPIKWSMRLFSMQVTAIVRGLWAVASIFLSPFIATMRVLCKVGNALVSAVLVPIGRQTVNALLVLFKPFVLFGHGLSTLVLNIAQALRALLASLITVMAACFAPLHKAASIICKVFRRLPTKVKKDDFEPGKVLLVNAGKAVAAAAQTTMTHVRAGGTTPHMSPASYHISAPGLAQRRTPTPPPVLQLPPNELDEARLARADRRS